MGGRMRRNVQIPLVDVLGMDSVMQKYIYSLLGDLNSH